VRALTAHYPAPVATTSDAPTPLGGIDPEKESGRCADEAVLNDLDADHRSCAFRIFLQGPTFLRARAGTEATRMPVGCALSVGLHRVELMAADDSG